MCKMSDNIDAIDDIDEPIDIEYIVEIEVPIKRGVGRPRKHPKKEVKDGDDNIKKPMGRPRMKDEERKPTDFRTKYQDEDFKQKYLAKKKERMQCPICNKDITKSSYEKHKISKNHIKASGMLNEID